MSYTRGMATPFCVASVFLLAVSGGLRATTITYDVGYAFGANPPFTNTPPWVSVTFTDLPGGGVDLLMSAVDLGPSADVRDWFFNEDAVSLSMLTITHVAGIVATISLDPDGIQGGGAGRYDIEFSFPHGQQANTFGTGDISEYVITGGGITAADFAALAAPHGNQPRFHTLAHVQGDPAVSGWVADSPLDTSQDSPVPEPGSLGLLAAGSALLLGPALFRRRRPN